MALGEVAEGLAVEIAAGDGGVGHEVDRLLVDGAVGLVDAHRVLAIHAGAEDRHEELVRPGGDILPGGNGGAEAHEVLVGIVKAQAEIAALYALDVCLALQGEPGGEAGAAPGAEVQVGIVGGQRLEGVVHVSGGKNTAVAIIPATILSEVPCVIENLPDIEDVHVSIDTLRHLGAKVD